MEATIAKVRDFARRQLSGEKVWRVGVTLTPNARVTLYTPDKPERFTAERDKDREPVVEKLQRALTNRYGQDIAVDVVQSPTAVVKYIRISPRKVRFVVDAVRGKSVRDALAILQFIPHSAAHTMTKLIKSATANAENNHRMDAELLEVMHVHVDEGPTLKRISQRAQGRAYHIMKRTSHITIGLAENERLSKVVKRGKGVAKTAAKAPRKAAKAEGAKTKSSAQSKASAAAKKTSEAAKPRTPRTKQRKGGE